MSVTITYHDVAVVIVIYYWYQLYTHTLFLVYSQMTLCDLIATLSKIVVI